MATEIGYELDGTWVTVPLDGHDELTIGRDRRNDIVLPIPWISRRHARLWRSEDGWRVADLGSSLGTRVNELGHANTVLVDGDRIWLHSFALTFGDRHGAVRPRHTVELTGSGEPAAIDPSATVIHEAVDFTSLAARRPDAAGRAGLVELMAETSRTILASHDLDRTLGRVLALARRQVAARRGFVMLREADDAPLEPRAVEVDEAAEGGPIRCSRTICERVLRDRVAVLTRDAQADSRFAHGASVVELGIRSAMAAPIWHEERVLGLIHVDTAERDVFSDFDLDVLSAIGNQLAVAVEQARLQRSILEQQVLRRRLERYHSPEVIQVIAERTAEQDGGLVAEELEATVLFADVVGFTARCERMAPREVATLLNRYFSEMAECVFEQAGTLDKFIGDCVMAVFGAPLPRDDHARRAVEAALDMREALERLNAACDPGERMAFRVGLHSGRVVAGDIGSARRSDYTVLGSTVNLAARLESAVAGEGQIVLSEATRQAAGDGYATRPLGKHRLKGIARAVLCHELLGRTSGPDVRTAPPD